ncbi:hypothetical protein E2562_024455 [Oryza meyeriana var. granulata]|uniref:FLZ-type domain-containing protein n=1 Tax=Oryza meyeriana var. granulata TaxID=110450 RepID=A0A6G1EYP4_9ORYZ|nr:hypothetical protein E2562_024455 [Oryza meyeriana var. granulata]
MLRKRAKPSSGGSSAKQHEIAFDHGHGGGGGAAAISAPKLFVASYGGEASPERQQEEAVVMSPTSTLQTASATSPAAVTCGRSSGTAVPFSRRSCSGGQDGDGRCKGNRPWDAKPVGLGLIGALNDGEDVPGDIASAASVLTGQRLRVQTNYYAPCSPSSMEFGVKSGGRGCAGAGATADHVAQYPSPRRRCLSPREMMEMSEDYTCVIARGPNPRTTHIFDNRVVESSGAYFPAELRLPSGGRDDDDFLRYCHGCSKDLGLGKDIFMYRGEKAFCSRECRYHEMLFDEGIEEL